MEHVSTIIVIDDGYKLNSTATWTRLNLTLLIQILPIEMNTCIKHDTRDLKTTTGKAINITLKLQIHFHNLSYANNITVIKTLICFDFNKTICWSMPYRK